jgi:hypothetical protein
VVKQTNAVRFEVHCSAAELYMFALQCSATSKYSQETFDRHQTEKYCGQSSPWSAASFTVEKKVKTRIASDAADQLFALL